MSDTIVFCIPGRTYSNYFLACWTETFAKCLQMGLTVIPPTWPTGCNIYSIRNACLLGDKEKGNKQKPFQNQFKYDYIMWIDSDSIWKITDFLELYNFIKKRKDIDILSGVYRKIDYDNLNLSTSVIIADTEDDVKLLTTKELDKLPEISEIRGAGLGFCIMRYGVMESLKYPWFIPLPITDKDSKELVDIAGDDWSLFIRLKQNGFKTWCATKIRIGHEKPHIYYME